jgi:predicted metal-dependent hydrolase
MEIRYRKHRQIKNIRITIKNSKEVLVTYPWWSSEKKAVVFVNSQKDWIAETLKTKKTKPSLLTGGSREDFLLNKEKARRLVHSKIVYFNRIYNFKYKRVSIRNTKTRWGSCSQKGNLNFSYRIIYLPEELANYLVVHELCHFREMNHSVRFWTLVDKTIPHGREISKKLRRL